MKNFLRQRVVSLLIICVVSCGAVGGVASAASNTGGKCTRVGATTKSGSTTLKCTKVGKNLVWVAQKATPSTKKGSGSGSGGSSSGSTASGAQSVMGQLGASCSAEGSVGWNGTLVGVCKGGKVRYALAVDVPKTPAGGYTSRPAWYPTLSQVIFGGNSKEPTCNPTSIKFTKPVIPLDKLTASIPYGMMIGGHVTPIDHAYFGITTLTKSNSEKTESDWISVSSPAAGRIISLQSLGSPDSNRVVIDHGCNVFTVYMVLNKLSGVLSSYVSQLASKGNLNLDIKVNAGDEFGKQRDNMLDFNVFDGTQWLSGFANPQAYLSAETFKPYTADFLPFFVEPIRGTIEKLMQKTSSPRVGKIDYDLVGTASGNWFLDGTNGYGGNFNSVYASATSPIEFGQVTGKHDYSWSHLAIAPHEVDNSKWIFSTGWWADSKGDATQTLLVIGAGQPAPDKLTSASGPVSYQLAQISYVEPAGSPSRAPGSQSTYAVGYTVVAGDNRGSVVIEVKSDGSLSINLNSGGVRIYQR